MAQKPKGISVFNYDSSLKYINEVIDSKGHGYKATVAKAVGCQSAYVSRVLSGQALFSLEQAERLNELFLHSEREETFFMNLVQRDRAGTQELRKYFNKILDSLRSERLDLKKSGAAFSEITDQDRYVYYSSWLYSAVYVLTSVPAYQDVTLIAEHLQLPPKQILEILTFLVEIGLVTHEKGKYVISGKNLHLPKDSPLITKHHINWRLRALQSVELKQPKDLHYSVVMSLSRKDSELIKGKLVEMIEEINTIPPQSKEEEAQVLCLDYFKL